jgi:hypothetical protein
MNYLIKSFLLFCGILFLGCNSTYKSIVGVGIGQFFNEEYGKPLILLIEYNPWSMYMGAEVPTFVLYENGQIIYRIIENHEIKLYQIKCPREQINYVIESFGIKKSIYFVTGKINAVSSFVTDQPYTVLILDYERQKTIGVYGLLPGNRCKKAMENFMSVYEKLVNYRGENAEEWLPERIEILFSEYNNARNRRQWIEGFPDLNSPDTIKRSEFDESYSVFISKAQFNEFIEYLSQRGDREATEINGKLMSISYRLPFPNIK